MIRAFLFYKGEYKDFLLTKQRDFYEAFVASHTFAV